jgi:hypothetical protein
VLDLLLPGDPLTEALHDEVATTVARCAVEHYNALGSADDPGAAGAEVRTTLDLLEAAASLARERTTAEFCARNIATIADAQVLAVVAPMLAAGNVDLAADVLRAWRDRCTDPALRERLERLADDPRAVRAPVEDAPARSGHLGCGIRPFGRRAEGDDGTWVETRCVAVFGAPIYPLAAYLSDEDFVYAKVPMSAWTRAAQVLLLAALAVLGAAMLLGLLGAAVATAVLGGAFGVESVRRRTQTRGWLAERTAS